MIRPPRPLPPAQRWPAHVRNFGKGAALKTGFSAALKGEFEWALAMDGDGQHKPQDVPAFLRCAEQTHARLVIGNRMHHAQAIPWLRRQVNRWMSRRISERAGQFLPDSQCGFRLVNLAAWAGLSLETDHFEIESEMLLAFVRAGYGIEFVPIQVVGQARTATSARFVMPAAGCGGGNAPGRQKCLPHAGGPCAPCRNAALSRATPASETVSCHVLLDTICLPAAALRKYPQTYGRTGCRPRHLPAPAIVVEATGVENRHVGSAGSAFRFRL